MMFNQAKKDERVTNKFVVKANKQPPSRIFNAPPSAVEPTDCKMSDWSSWSSCSVPCGGGERVRTRQVIVQPTNGGEGCGNTIEREACNTQSCPIDCKVSDWNEWSTCTVPCEGVGTQTRSRTILQQSTEGGKECPVLNEKRTCGQQPCPIDCKVGEWSDWSACDKSCGGGLSKRTRKVITEPKHGGDECPALVETKVCNTKPCPEDCQVSEWSAWSTCSKTCGGGTQTRTRVVNKQAAHGGKECPTTLTETQQCNTQGCPVNCEVGGWSEWGTCSKTCGGGTQTRTRKPTVQPANGGKDCPSLSETQQCNIQACPPPPPTLSTNGKCGPENGNTHCPDGQCCSTKGVCGTGSDQCYTNRRLDTAYHGKNPPLANIFAPVNCEVSTWSDWGACDKTCGGGTQARARTVTKQALNGGTPCPELKETKSCNSQACPTDCETSAWSSWSACSKSCGGGTQTRSRTITKPATNGGKDCGTVVETQACNTLACPSDCVTSDWSSWGACSKSCGTGTQTRTKSVTKPAANGGKDCGALTETQNCNTQACVVPGAVVSKNGQCGPENGETRCPDGQCCSVFGWCGSGKDHCVNAKRPDTIYDGRNAPSSSSFDKVDCQVSGWSSWSACDKTCGGGTQTRSRSVTKQPANGGASCPSLSESQSCNTQACPPPAPVTCDTTACSRVINDYLARGWGYTSSSFGECKGCPVVSYPNRLPSSTPPPPPPVNCEVSGWSSWSACDKTCGGGTQTRSRSVTKQPANGGTSCPSLSESQSCNTQACPPPPSTGCDTSACSRVINDYLARGWWYTSSSFGECKSCPVVSYPNKLPASSCDKTACSRVINDYLARGWGYTSSSFGECKGCPVVSYPNRLP